MGPWGRTPFLALLPDDERARLTARAVSRSLPRKGILYLAGTSGVVTYLVTAGAIKLVGRDENGHETILGLALPGDLVGAEAAIDGLPQPTDAVAASHSTVLGLDTRLLLRAMHRDGRAAVAVARAVSWRLRWTYSSAVERTASTAPARLAARILELAEILGRPAGAAIEIEVPMAQTDLAGLAGMCRESASKVLSGLKREGILEREGRCLRILRPDLLDRVRYDGRLPSGAPGKKP